MWMSAPANYPYGHFVQIMDVSRLDQIVIVWMRERLQRIEKKAGDFDAWKMREFQIIKYIKI